jgi:hypothetical protein
LHPKQAKYTTLKNLSLLALSRCSTLSGQRLPPRHTSWVQIRPLSQANRAVSFPLSIVTLEVIRSSSVVHTPVIPDGEIVRVLPPVTDLQIVVIDEQSHEPCEKSLALELAHVVHLAYVLADGKDGLPARDGVGADDGVDGLEELADVLGGAAGLGVELEAVPLGGLVEAGLCVGGGQGLEEFLVWFGDAVV